jgi:soluble lytic murein transglycosylase
MTRIAPHLAIGALVALLLPCPAVGQGRASVPGAGGGSALDEVAAGRFWHASRSLRAEGAAAGGPEEILLLARAEAGWRNWSAVGELLEGAGWLDAVGAGEGWLLLGRAQEARGRWDSAAGAYDRFLHLAAADERGRGPVLGRRARVSARAGDFGGALQALDAISSREIVVKSWVAMELAGPVSERGDTALLGSLLRRVVDGTARRGAWRLLPEALLAAGDTLRAESAYVEVAGELTGEDAADARVEAGRLLLRRGDSATARAFLTGAMDEASRRGQGRAAGALLELGGHDLSTTLRLAEILDRAGDGGRALRAYDQAASQVGRDGSRLSDASRLSRARLMSTVRSRQAEALEEFRDIHATTADETIGAQNLQAWISMRRRQGRTDAVRTLRRWLLEEYPASASAAEIVWERGASAESRGDLAGALVHYREVAENAWDEARAGQARMRTGQILLGTGRAAEAADVYEGYLTDFPEGRRWEEASYWAARTRLELGDTAAALRWIGRVRREQPVSYYAVMGADLFGEPYHVHVPSGPPSLEAGWLIDGLRRLDLLLDAGLAEGAEAEERRLVARAKGSPGLTLRLAEGLIERGRTIAAINLGWDLRRAGHPWSRRLLEVVYPFPYREIVVREAAEWGLDPYLLAAMIRQESAFEAEIVSRAGAVGLMQVMPTTGRGLASSHGPDPFHESNLTAPEVNLHLGAAFLTEMIQRYDGDLPVVLSAYNAGPTRATRWRRYPEASDPLRFTERIPFEETRGYVKNVRRNLGLYQILYGQS